MRLKDFVALPTKEVCPTVARATLAVAYLQTYAQDFLPSRIPVLDRAIALLTVRCTVAEEASAGRRPGTSPHAEGKESGVGV